MKGYGKTIHAKIPKVFIHLKTEINSLAILRKIYLKDKDPQKLKIQEIIMETFLKAISMGKEDSNIQMAHIMKVIGRRIRWTEKDYLYQIMVQ